MEAIPSKIHPSWVPFLQPLFDDHKMLLIRDFILPKVPFYPSSSNIFKVFEMPLEHIKVVILGQDPYPSGQATGLAFAVGASDKMPSSLKIIREEILDSKADLREEINTPEWKNLTHWEKQGVFLLNTALTVEAGVAGSHVNCWKWFTEEVLRIISENTKCVWLLWGSKAQSYKEYISQRTHHTCILLDADSHRLTESNYYMTAPHPAAQLYSGGKVTFKGCDHFNLCNEVLKLKNLKTINW